MPIPEIPIVDIRDGGPLRHVRDGNARARALRDDCVGWFPPATRPFIPTLDGLARRWLRCSASPYVAEVEAIAATLGCSGVWLLNASYQCCCTALARDEGGHPWLARTLDWPFAGLGRSLEIARMSGAAGEFYNASWPGYVGALTAMAPGRFAAALNQAPLWRRTQHPWLRPADVVANAMNTWWSIRHIPPDQLLRHVFESCENYTDAKQVLKTIPIARPAIFTLVGCRPGERCVIERTENAAECREEQTSAANDWLNSRPGWEARVGGDLMLTCSFSGAAENSRERRRAIAEWRGSFAADSFGWIAPPILNPYTRLAIEMCPATGMMRALGFEREPGEKLPQPVTAPQTLYAERAAA